MLALGLACFLVLRAGAFPSPDLDISQMEVPYEPRILQAAQEVWLVNSGPCIVAGQCVMSGNFPNSYDNHENCDIAFNGPPGSTLKVVAFDTENNYDFVGLNGVKYSGSMSTSSYATDRHDKPIDLDGKPAGPLSWGSDGGVCRPGWKICSVEPVFQVTEGSCFADSSACVHSPNATNWSGKCSIVYNGQGVHTAVAEGTAVTGTFTMNGIEYSGNGQLLTGQRAGDITWLSTSTSSDANWTLCPATAASFTVTYGNCTVDDVVGCVMTPKFPAPFDENQYCEVLVSGTPAVFQVEHFDLETSGQLILHGQTFRSSPNTFSLDGHNRDGVALDGQAAVNFTWQSYYTANKTGWKLCLAAVGPDLNLPGNFQVHQQVEYHPNSSSSLTKLTSGAVGNVTSSSADGTHLVVQFPSGPVHVGPGQDIQVGELTSIALPGGFKVLPVIPQPCLLAWASGPATRRGLVHECLLLCHDADLERNKPLVFGDFKGFSPSAYACWKTTLLRFNLGAQVPQLPECRTSPDSAYYVQGDKAYCKDRCGEVYQRYIKSSYSAAYYHVSMLYWNGLGIEDACPQTQYRTDRSWDHGLPGCGAINRFDVTSRDQTKQCASSCADANIGVRSFECFAATLGYTSSRMHYVCLKAETAVSMSGLTAAAQLVLMLLYALNAVAWAWMRPDNVEQKKGCVPQCKHLLLVCHWAKVSAAEEALEEEETQPLAETLDDPTETQVNLKAHWKGWGEQRIKTRFPLNLVVKSMTAKRAAKLAVLQNAGMMTLDRVSDVGSVFAYLSNGQIVYAVIMVGAVSCTGDPFQVDGMRSLRRSIEEGFLTEDLLHDRSKEGYYEGICGVLVPGLALIFVGRMDGGQPDVVSVLQLLFAMATSLNAIYGQAESLYLSEALTKLKTNDAVLQSVLIQEMENHGLFWARIMLPLRVLSIIPIIAISATEAKAQDGYLAALVALGVLCAMSLLPHNPTIGLDDVWRRCSSLCCCCCCCCWERCSSLCCCCCCCSGFFSSCFGCLSSCLRGLRPIVGLVVTMMAAAASLSAWLSVSSLSTLFIRFSFHGFNDPGTGFYLNPHLVAGASSLTFNLQWQGKLLVDGLLFIGALAAFLMPFVYCRATSAHYQLKSYIENLDPENWGEVCQQRYRAWLDMKEAPFAQTLKGIYHEEVVETDEWLNQAMDALEAEEEESDGDTEEETAPSSGAGSDSTSGTLRLAAGQEIAPLLRR